MIGKNYLKRVQNDEISIKKAKNLKINEAFATLMLAFGGCTCPNAENMNYDCDGSCKHKDLQAFIGCQRISQVA